MQTKNFLAGSQVNVRSSRRNFLRELSASAAFTIVPRHVLGGAGYIAPSDTVILAVIGAGSQGISDMKNLLQETDVRVAAIADPAGSYTRRPNDPQNSAGRLPAARIVKDHYANIDPKSSVLCSEYRDFRILLEKEKSVDAVLVATPDHVHAVAVMAAVKAGKHVFCEKPLGHTLYEVRQLTQAAREAKVATQMGNQGHSGEGLRLTCEWIWDGAIGTVREVHGFIRGEAYTELKRRPVEALPVPDDLDWDLWLGPAPYRPFHSAYHPGLWRGWYDFGTGLFGDFACHHLDPAFSALQLGYPTSVEASICGPREETFPTASLIYYDFPSRQGMPPVKLYWYDGGLMPPTPEEMEPGRKLTRSNHGILFIGDKGKMLCGGWAGSPRLIPEKAMQEYQRPEKTLPRGKGHFRDWLDACKGGPPASANFDNVGLMVEAVLMGNISQRTGEKLYWDGPGMRCTNLAAANDFVNPPYRQGWSL